jgi:hypothetical protein
MSKIQVYVHRLALQRNKYTKKITSSNRLHRRYLFISQIRLVDRNNPHHTPRNARAVADHDSSAARAVFVWDKVSLHSGRRSMRVIVANSIVTGRNATVSRHACKVVAPQSGSRSNSDRLRRCQLVTLRVPFGSEGHMS